MDTVAVVILAAGKGKRMNSKTAKVLQTINSKPMIQYVVDAAVGLAGSNVIVVLGTQADQVRAAVSANHPDIGFAMQEKQDGTGHAVLCAIPELLDNIEHVLILCGDVPFIKTSTLNNMVHAHMQQENVITVLGATLQNPTGYGRLVTNKQQQVRNIVEEADATTVEKDIQLINTGVYCVNRSLLEIMLNQIKADNSQNELYLTDIVGIAANKGYKMGMIQCSNSDEILGINTPYDLEKAVAVLSAIENP